MNGFFPLGKLLLKSNLLCKEVVIVDCVAVGGKSCMQGKKLLIQYVFCLSRHTELVYRALSNLYGFSYVSGHLLISAFIWDEVLHFPHSLIKS